MIDYAQLNQHMMDVMTNAKLMGLGVAVVEGDKITYSEVFGTLNSPSRRPLTRETQFQGASLSKPVFAYAVLKLCEKGILDLDTPLMHYWPESPCDDPRALKITARHVLSHTAGFPSWRDEDDEGGGKLRILADPGTTFCYSGEGFQYLQKVVEYITQQPLYAFIQTNLLFPLGMHHSTFAWSTPCSEPTMDENGNPMPMVDEDGNIVAEGQYLMSAAAYSLLSNAHDYARFLLAMLNPVDNDTARLNRASIDAMLTPQIQVGQRSDLTWGLGWGIQQTAAGVAYWHWGGGQNDYYNYALFFRQQRKGVTIFTNTDGGLGVCEAIGRMALAIDVPHPAFEWLLPIDRWLPHG